MPSGFQQDNNQLSPAYFRVVIDMDNGEDAWYNQANNDGDTTTGRITTWAWDNAGDNASRLPQTQEIADALARGNMRFQAIVDMLGLFADCQILDIENPGNDFAADQVDQDTIAFTVKYDRNEFLIPGFVSYAKANPNLYDYGTNGTLEFDGATYTSYFSASGQEFAIDNEERVIKELVYLGARRQNYTKSVRVFEPVEGADPMIGSGLQKVIEIDRPADSTSYIFDNITVTTIDGTTTTQSFD
jgi:hypothetical protein